MRYIKKQLLVIIWMLAILIFSVMPAGDELEPAVPNVGHFLEYAILGALIFWAKSGSQSAICLGDSCKRASIYSITAATLYGIIMEIVQLFVPYRSFSVADMLLNFAGATTAVLLFRFTRLRSA